MRNYNLALKEYDIGVKKYDDYLVRISYALDVFAAIIIDNIKNNDEIHKQLLKIYEDIYEDFENIRWWAQDIFQKAIKDDDTTTIFGNVRTALEAHILAGDYCLYEDQIDSAYDIYKKALDLIEPAKQYCKMKEDKMLVQEIYGELLAKLAFTTNDLKEKKECFDASLPAFDKVNTNTFSFEGYCRLEAMYYLLQVANVEDFMSQEAYDFLLERYDKYLYNFTEIEYGDMLMYCHFMTIGEKLGYCQDDRYALTTFAHEISYLVVILGRKHSDLLIHFIQQVIKKTDKLLIKFKDEKIDHEINCINDAKEALKQYLSQA